MTETRTSYCAACKEMADRIEALEARVAELEDIAGDLLTRFEPWSPHDHDAAKRARAALEGTSHE